MKEKRILCIEVNGECRHFTDVNTPARIAKKVGIKATQESRPVRKLQRPFIKRCALIFRKCS